MIFTPLPSYKVSPSVASYEETTSTSLCLTQKYGRRHPRILKWLNCILLHFWKPINCQAQTRFVVWLIVRENVTDSISITQRYEQPSPMRSSRSEDANIRTARQPL